MRFVNFDGYGPDGRRIYRKGGGDGGANEMRRQETERRLRTQAATDQINDIFTGGPAHKRGSSMMLDPAAVQFGQTYYDAHGNPVVLSDPAAGNGPWELLAKGLKNRGEAAQAAINQGIYSGVEDVPESSGFNDDYFNNIADSFVKFQQPILDEQAATARRELPYHFASSDSSEYIRKKGELERDVAREEAQVREQGIDTANKQRAAVEQNRSDLVQLANAGTDAGTVAQLANTRAAALAKPPAFTPIADLFQKYTALAANAQLQPQSSAYPYNFLAPRNTLYTSSPGASVRYVGGE